MNVSFFCGAARVSSKTYVRLTTSKLDTLIGKVGKGWNTTLRLLLFEFQIKNDKIVLKLIIGRGDDSIRQKLYNISASNGTCKG